MSKKNFILSWVEHEKKFYNLGAWCEKATRLYGNNLFGDIKVNPTLKEIISQTDWHLVSLSSKTYVFEDKMTKY